MTTPVTPPATVTPPPAATPTPSTIMPPVATTPANPSPSTSQASAPGSSEPAAAVPPATPAPGEPVVPPAPAAVTPPAPATVEEEFDIELDENSPLSQGEIDAIVKYAEKYNLSKEDTQAMVVAQESLYSRGRSEIEGRLTQEQETRRQAIITHADFSGERAADSWHSVDLAVQAFGTPELIAALKDPNKHGYDLSVALMLKNIGDQLRPEGTPPGKGVAVSASKTAQDAEDVKLRRLYPKLYKDEK